MPGDYPRSVCGDTHAETGAVCVLPALHVGRHRSVVVAGPPPLAIVEWEHGVVVSSFMPEQNGGGK